MARHVSGGQNGIRSLACRGGIGTAVHWSAQLRNHNHNDTSVARFQYGRRPGFDRTRMFCFLTHYGTNVVVLTRAEWTRRQNASDVRRLQCVVATLFDRHRRIRDGGNRTLRRSLHLVATLRSVAGRYATGNFFQSARTRRCSPSSARPTVETVETTFGLPDLRGRTPISSGRGPGLSDYRLGQRGGTETNSQVPAHTHPLAGGTATIKCNSSAAGEEDPTGNYLAATGEVTYSDESDSTMAANGVTLSGNTASHGTTGGVNNLQPYLAINWEIALVGQFPPRN